MPSPPLLHRLRYVNILNHYCAKFKIDFNSAVFQTFNVFRVVAPPPKPARDAVRRSQNSDDIFGLSPFKATPRPPAGQPRTSASDPFGMDDFGQTVQNGGVENDIGLLDKRIKEMKVNCIITCERFKSHW